MQTTCVGLSLQTSHHELLAQPFTTKTTTGCFCEKLMHRNTIKTLFSLSEETQHNCFIITVIRSFKEPQTSSQRAALSRALQRADSPIWKVVVKSILHQHCREIETSFRPSVCALHGQTFCGFCCIFILRWTTKDTKLTEHCLTN